MRALVVTWRLSSRVAFVGLAAAGIAACSADTTRFSNPNASPYASSHSGAPTAEYTSSSTVQSAPVSQVTAQPLPPPPNSHSAPMSAPMSTPGVSGGSTGMGSYNPGPYSAAPTVAPPPTRAALPPPPARDVTGSVRATPNGWSQNGGTAVTVAPGETVDTLASRYGVPASAIMQANNLSGPAALQPGQRIVIPRYNYAAAGAPVSAMPHPTKPPVTTAAAPAPAPAATASTGAGHVHVVAPGETLMSIARHYHKPLGRIATVNHIPPSTHVKVGDRITIPGVVAPALRQPAVAAAPPPAVAAPKIQAPARTAQAMPAPAAETTSSARIASAGPQATTETAASGGAPAFRWPLRGRVIAGYGPKSNGQQNDGVDLAVPEGTAVHAAEDGVVAYAGSELKGYGNLILIRHSNGFVTAYAHASEIMVKRNDPVRRGQVIAKSGQTGSVTAPQLHFEIRKGSSPVDPTQYLPAGGA